MGYFISVLSKGKKYELNGKKLEFIQKYDNLYYFYICEYDEWSFKYYPTSVIAEYSAKEINFIKPLKDEQEKGFLKRIGRDKVFQRY